MTRKFGDSSFYIAAVNPRDEKHVQADSFARNYRGEIITTEFILVEVGNWLSRTGDRQVFLNLLRRIEVDPLTTVVEASHDLVHRGVELFAKRPDKDWSLTDCISFVVMGEHGLAEALTADHHFVQAGFRILLT